MRWGEERGRAAVGGRGTVTLTGRLPEGLGGLAGWTGGCAGGRLQAGLTARQAEARAPETCSHRQGSSGRGGHLHAVLKVSSVHQARDHMALQDLREGEARQGGARVGPRGLTCAAPDERQAGGWGAGPPQEGRGRQQKQAQGSRTGEKRRLRGRSVWGGVGGWVSLPRAAAPGWRGRWGWRRQRSARGERWPAELGRQRRWVPAG